MQGLTKLKTDNMERESLGDFIRRAYLERIGEMPALCASDFEDAIYLGVRWQKEQSELDAEQQAKSISRVEVIDSTGRAYACHSAKDVELSFQDEGKTLKVFLK